jgi:hypothetical protein
VLGRCRQVDLVGTDAERAHREQIARLLEHLGRQLRGRPDAEHLHAVDALDQLVAVERAVVRLHLVAATGQQVGRVGVDVLEQQDPQVGRRCHTPIVPSHYQLGRSGLDL